MNRLFIQQALGAFPTETRKVAISSAVRVLDGETDDRNVFCLKAHTGAKTKVNVFLRDALTDCVSNGILPRADIVAVLALLLLIGKHRETRKSRQASNHNKIHIHKYTPLATCRPAYQEPSSMVVRNIPGKTEG